MMLTTIRKLGKSLYAFSAHDDAASKRPAKKCASTIPACIRNISGSSGLKRGLRNAEMAYARMHRTAETDLVALFKALGGGWDPAPQTARNHSHP